jgi:hypothetical protein
MTFVSVPPDIYLKRKGRHENAGGGEGKENNADYPFKKFGSHPMP